MSVDDVDDRFMKMIHQKKKELWLLEKNRIFLSMADNGIHLLYFYRLYYLFESARLRSVADFDCKLM